MPPDNEDPLAVLAEEEAQSMEPVATEVENDEPEPEEEEEPELSAAEYEAKIEKLQQSVEHGTRKISEQGEELGWRRQLDQQRQVEQQPQQTQSQSGELTKEQLDDWYIEDPISAQAYVTQMIVNQALEQQAQQFEPIVQQVNMTGAAGALDTLKRELGPNGEQMLADNSDALHEAIAADENHFIDPKTRVARMKRAVLAAQYEREVLGASPQKSRKSPGVGGGSGAAPQTRRSEPVDPAEQELRDLLPPQGGGYSRPVDEHGIPLPR